MNNSTGPNWAVLIFVAFCALGAGISGTLLWMQNQNRASSALVPISSAPPTPQTPDTETTSTPEPPPNLTVGMSPAQAALTFGNWYYDHQQWKRAVDNYQNALKAGLDNADVRTDLGSALRFSGEPQKALQQYQRAQKEDPTHENSLFNQGGLYAFDLKQPQKGIAVWRKYLQTFPNGQSASQAKELIEKAREQSK